MEEHGKKKLTQELRSKCLDRALALYGASKYAAGEVTIGKPEDIISAAKSFYNYIEKGE